MRIVLTAAEYTWPDYSGGIKTYIRAVTEKLVAFGHEVHLITTAIGEPDHSYLENGIWIHCVEAPRLLPVKKNTKAQSATAPQKGTNELLGAIHLFRRSIAIYNKVVELASTTPIDIVEVPDWGAEGLWLTLKPIVPVVVTLHGPRFFVNKFNHAPKGLGARLSEYMEKIAILRASAIVGISITMQNMTAEAYQMPSLKQRIKVISNPVNIELFKPSIKNPVLANDEALTVTYVGRMEHRKGVHILADAISEIKKAHPRVKFKFVGTDTSTALQGGSMKDYIRSKFQGNDDFIEFTGRIPHEQLSPYYANSTIVVVPSLEEPFGYTCTEAMACGACVIASNIGGLSEMIANGVNGYLIPPANPAVLSNTIIDILNQPEQREKIGKAARKTVCEQYSSDVIVKRKLELYEQLSQQAKKKR